MSIRCATSGFKGVLQVFAVIPTTYFFIILPCLKHCVLSLSPICFICFTSTESSFFPVSSWSALLCYSLSIITFIMDDTSLVFCNKKISFLIGDENFQSWTNQVILTVQGFNLKSHLFDTIAIPQFIVDADGTTHKIGSMRSSFNVISL